MYEMHYRFALEVDVEHAMRIHNIQGPMHRVNEHTRTLSVKRDFVASFDNLLDAYLASDDLRHYATEDFEECARVLAYDAEIGLNGGWTVHEWYDYILEMVSPEIENVHIVFAKAPAIEGYKLAIFTRLASSIAGLIDFYDVWPASLGGVSDEEVRAATLPVSDKMGISPETLVFQHLLSEYHLSDGNVWGFEVAKFNHFVASAPPEHVRAVMVLLEEQEVGLQNCYIKYRDGGWEPPQFEDPRAMRLWHKISTNGVADWSAFLAHRDVRRAWAVLRVAVVLMGVHKRSVISANHPDRKRKRGEFDVVEF